MRRPGMPASAAAIPLALLISFGAADAQSTVEEWWPEIDAYRTDASGTFRLFAMAASARSADAAERQYKIGMHLDYLRLPWGVVRTGYRYMGSSSDEKSREQRVLFEATLPKTRGRLRFRNRTRLELRWISGEPSQRLRERVRLEGETTARGRHLTPYAMDEVSYDSRYHSISRNRFFVGAELSVGAHSTFDLAYCREEDRFSTIRKVNALVPKLAIRY